MEVSLSLLSAIIGVSLVLAQIISKLIDFVISKMSNKVELNEKDIMELRMLIEMHKKTDENGMPLWYIPRSLTSNIRDINQILLSISNSQENTAKVLEKVTTVLESLNQRQAIIESKSSG